MFSPTLSVSLLQPETTTIDDLLFSWRWGLSREEFSEDKAKEASEEEEAAIACDQRWQSSAFEATDPDSRTMGDHLALLVDHLLTESTLEAAIGNGKQAQIAADSASSGDLGSNSTPDTSVGHRTPSGKLVECRICQEDDHDSNMEIPCSCCGSLKYAHRVCIQRWCNEKGNTMCEICLQQFKPGYTALPKLFHYGRAPMNFRGSWDVSSQDLHDPQILTVVPSGVIESNYYDQLVSRLRSAICCRSVTIIFMILLVLRHTLPLIISGAEQYSFTLFSLLVLRTAGILVPIFFIAGTLTTFHHSRRRQATRRILSASSSQAENM
ncbi:unnamed protein product [Musa acuminata var. zebrina]